MAVRHPRGCRSARPGPRTRSAELGQTAAEVADGLVGPLLVVDQGEANVAVAAGTEAEPRRGGDLGVVDEQLGELERAHVAVRLGDGRPDEHRAARWDDLPADAVE